jgi:hypothetical protein
LEFNHLPVVLATLRRLNILSSLVVAAVELDSPVAVVAAVQ